MQLERPNITSKEPKEQVQEIKSYLFKLVEQLELALESIDENNLSSSMLEIIKKQNEEIAKLKSDMQYQQESMKVYVDKQIATLRSEIT